MADGAIESWKWRFDFGMFAVEICGDPDVGLVDDEAPLLKVQVGSEEQRVIARFVSRESADELVDLLLWLQKQWPAPPGAVDG